MKPILLLAPLLLASACSAPAPSDATSGAQPPARRAASATAAATATGTITAIDATAGTVTIAHGPVAALGWPAMTMPFKASPAQLAGLRPGQKVDFAFDGDSAAIVRIAPAH